MEENQRPSSIEIANNFDDIFKSVSDVKQEEVKTPVVEQQVITTEQKQEEVIVEQVTSKPSQYKERLNQLIEDNFLENIAIGITKENGEKENVFLSDLEDVDQETYQTILSNYKSAKDKERDEKYISTEGIDDVTKSLIEVRRAGGDITELIKNNVSAIDQWISTKDKLADDTQLQIDVVAWDLKNKGIADGVIQAQIKHYVDNLQLDTEAEKIVDSHLTAHKQEIENKKNSELQRVEQEKETQKQTKKAVSTIYKSQNLPDHLQKVLIENATKVDQSGMTNTEKLFFEATRTADDLAEVTFFLSNREEYKKWVSSKPVLKAQVQGMKPIFELDLKTTKPVKRAPITVDENYDEVFNK
jgi:hypothetical protein